MVMVWEGKRHKTWPSKFYFPGLVSKRRAGRWDRDGMGWDGMGWDGMRPELEKSISPLLFDKNTAAAAAAAADETFCHQNPS
jgi:hypothetical protein